MHGILARIAAVSSAALAPLAPAQARDPIIVPFEFRSDIVLVRAEVNGEPVTLILDSGSGVCVLDSGLAARVHLEASGPPARLSGNREATVRLSTARSIRLGNAEIRNVLVAPVDLTAVQARLGPDVGGTIGYDLFVRYVVMVDYAHRTLTLRDPGAFQYTGPGLIVPVTTATRVPIADAVLVTRRAGSIPVRLTLDLGSTSWAVRLGTRVVQRHGLARDTATIAVPFGTGVGGSSHGALLRMPELRLGPLVIARPSTALATDTTGAFGPQAIQDGTVGAPVFRRTLAIFDYARARVILEPRDRLDLPDSVDASGLSLIVEGDDTATLLIQNVVAGSAADGAGIQVGDRLVAVDDRAASVATLDATRQLLRSAGVTRRLTLRRGGKTIIISITLRMLV